MARYEHSIDVHVPLETAYNQWTQFEEFPMFMEGVKSVTQVTDTRLHWVAEIGGQEREWDAEISEQKPDTRIAWHSISGAKNAGVVTFHYIDRETTRVMLQIEYDPEGFIENVGAALGVVQRRISGDLERFKDFIEAKGVETGAWRGTVDRYPQNQGPSGSRYSEKTMANDASWAAGTSAHHAMASSSEDRENDTMGNRDHETMTTFSSGSTGEVTSPSQNPDYGTADERGQRNVLGDDTFISSGEGDGTNNGGGGIPSTETTNMTPYGTDVAGDTVGKNRYDTGLDTIDSENLAREGSGMREGMIGNYGGWAGGTAVDEHGQTAEASGSDPRLYNDDISRGKSPGSEPAHAYGAVEDMPPGEDWGDDERDRQNTPTNSI